MKVKETVRDAAEREYPDNHQMYEYSAFIEGAEWQEQRNYSEEEVIKLLDKREDFLNEISIIDYTSTKEWFEQFKK